MRVNAVQVAGIIKDCAGKHLLPYFNTLTDNQVFQKDEAGDIVTRADLETEEALIRELKILYPDAMYIGEESFDPHNQDMMTAPAVFVIDPLDGTAAFRNGQKGFAIMVAYLENGALTQSWLYAPLMNVSIYAEKGKNVFLNDIKIEPKQSIEIVHQTGTGHLSPNHRPEMRAMAENFVANKMVQASHTHACMDFLNFIKGDVDYILYQNCYPWDILPGVLMVHELGGHAALLYDEKDLMTESFADILQPTLYARSLQDWHKIKSIALKDN